MKYRYLLANGLAYEFGALNEEDVEIARRVVQLLGLLMKWPRNIRLEHGTEPGSVTVITEIGPVQFAESHPEIARTIRKLVGEEYWQMHDKGLAGGFTIEWHL